jgi:hypothetical protein
LTGYHILNMGSRVENFKDLTSGSSCILNQLNSILSQGLPVQAA